MSKPRFMLVTFAAVLLSAATFELRTTAQSPDPRTLPKLEYSNLEYLGAFRLPNTTTNGKSFTFAQGLIAYNPAGNGGNGSLFVGWGNVSDWTNDNTARMTEVTIPEPSLSGNINALNMAAYLQDFKDPTEQHLDEVSADPQFIGLNGHMVFGDRLIGTASSSYDAGNTLRVTHYSRSLNLAQPSFQGWSEVWETAKAGYVSGWLANIPSEWQSALGGPAITGNCCVSIISRTSWGPAAFAFNPASVGQPSVAATPLLYYDGAHPTLGDYNSTQPTEVWGQSTMIRGATIINGTRTLLYFGSNGTGEPCYGGTTNDPEMHNEPNPAGHHWCYDPPNGGTSGNHAYPYRFQIWAYDLNDLADVKAGTKNPWQPVPDVWPLTDLPSNATMPNQRLRPGGIAYAPATQRLYVVADFIDEDGYSSRPLVYVYKVNITSSTNTVSNVDVSADRAAPQPPATTITFTATATGGVTPYQYQWKIFDGSTWTPQPWNGSSTFQWTPASANSSYKVSVDVRSAGSTGAAEASEEMPFAIASGGGTASAITITSDLAAPQPVGTPITWSAAITGGTAPYQYKWWFWDGGAWFPQTGWTSSSTYTWTPIYGNANYRFGAWVRSTGSSSETAEATTEEPFPTTGPGPATDVSLATSHPSPQPLGSTITWTATPTGGVPQHQYKWFTLEASGWVLAKDWSTDNTFVWTPTATGSSHKVGVWVRSARNTNDALEASTSVWYTIQ